MTLRHTRRPLAVATVAWLSLGVALAWMPAAALSTSAAEPARADEDNNAGSVSLTKTLTRQFVEDDGSTYSFPSNNVTVTVSETKELRGRQRILVSWTGAQPSGGRAANPYGENGLQQEYPVVIMQCRGIDDPSLPLEQQVRPETCWTNSVAQRSQIGRGANDAIWTKDLFAPEGDRQRLSGVAPFPTKEECPTADVDPYYSHLTPFVSASGTVFLACDSEHMPPEAAVGAAFPPAEIAAFTDEAGNGSVQFEVRSDVENESLGCNRKTACSIVVIPINGLSCVQASKPPSVTDTNCRLGGQFPPGSSNFASRGVDASASPALWWSGTNWANRFSIPVTFGLPPDTCDILDPRPPTGFYGSELMAQAALQWSPAYCLSKKRFKFQLNQMSDDAGWNLMESGGAAAAFVSSAHKRRGPDPVGYAPTAVTGFGIGYVIDRPDNAGEYDDLRLNQRLVAKLLTQSYLGSDLGRGHPGIESNPLGIMNDPEFITLNPGLSQVSQEAGAALLSLSNDSDLVHQLTEWIASDSSAMDFVKGKPDPWGMKVNPNYKKIKLPRGEWPLLDDYIPETQNACRQANPAVYFTQLAAPVTTLRKIAEALLDGWPNVQTRCDFDATTNSYKLGRIDRQNYGSRFMLGVVSLGDAERYGLRSARLMTKKDSYVGPSDASLSAALSVMEQKKKREPFVLDQKDVRKSGKAYPGTMVVYTAARLRNMLEDDAARVAQFIEISTSEGQKPGVGNGELPDGYLPIKKSGATKKLHESAREVAKAVEAQRPAKSETEAPAATEDAAPAPAPVSTGGGGAVVPEAPPASDPSTKPEPSPEPAAPSPAPVAEPVTMPVTEAVSSDLGNRLIPALLLIGLIAIAVVGAIRFFVQPPRGTPR